MDGRIFDLLPRSSLFLLARRTLLARSKSDYQQEKQWYTAVWSHFVLICEKSSATQVPFELLQELWVQARMVETYMKKIFRFFFQLPVPKRFVFMKKIP